jgi:hypothetical protein
MIAQIFPQDFPRFLSLPVLGTLMDRYAGWLHEQRYTWRSTRYDLHPAHSGLFRGRQTPC